MRRAEEIDNWNLTGGAKSMRRLASSLFCAAIALVGFSVRRDRRGALAVVWITGLGGATPPIESNLVQALNGRIGSEFRYKQLQPSRWDLERRRDLIVCCRLNLHHAEVYGYDDRCE